MRVLLLLVEFMQKVEKQSFIISLNAGKKAVFNLADKSILNLLRCFFVLKFACECITAAF